MKSICRITRPRIALRYLSAAAPAQGIPLSDGPAAPAPSSEKYIAPHITELVDKIAALPLLDVADLNYALKKKLNIPDQPMFAAGAVMAAPSAAAEPEAPEDDAPKKMTFAVKLTKFDDSKKIALIKEIRTAISGLNLVQAKKFVETAPVEVKADLGKNEAEELKAILEKAGATCEIKLSEDMARGHQKIQSQQKNAKKQEQLKKQAGSDQKTAAQKALLFKCTVCMAQMPDPKTYKQHFESKHPKSPMPAELVDVVA